VGTFQENTSGRLRGRAAVLNLGIGGNRLPAHGNGPGALSRFDRDVLGQAGVGTLIVLSGINDIGTFGRDRAADAAAHAGLVTRITGVLRQLALRARARGLAVLAGTLMPSTGAANYRPDAAAEADRTAVNCWTRTSGVFDGVIDFSRLLCDPA